MRRHRLQWQIFFAIALAGLFCLLAAAFVGFVLRDDPMQMPDVVKDVGAFIIDELPHDNPRVFERGIEKRARRLHASISVWDERGRLIARAGRPLPGPRERRRPHVFDHRAGTLVTLDDGRSVAISLNAHRSPFGALHLWGPLLFLTAALFVGSHWAARRITRRLFALESSVSRFGRGELEVRAQERGDDEISRLARVFNRSAARIASLVRSQRRMLQSASHELRSPLARVRMALELLREGGLDEETRAKLAKNVERDIEELDELISELLLAARLEDTELKKEFSRVDLSALLRAEAERVGATVDLVDVELDGDARLLKTLVRNLLENARKHGKEPITATLVRADNSVDLTVRDHGSGVREEDRERIFEPFYRPSGTREGQGGGVGLGLFLVRSVARHHGGDVSCVPSDVGACFRAQLPIKQGR